MGTAAPAGCCPSPRPPARGRKHADTNPGRGAPAPGTPRLTRRRTLPRCLHRCGPHLIASPTSMSPCRTTTISYSCVAWWGGGARGVRACEGACLGACARVRVRACMVQPAGAHAAGSSQAYSSERPWQSPCSPTTTHPAPLATHAPTLGMKYSVAGSASLPPPPTHTRKRPHLEDEVLCRLQPPRGALAAERGVQRRVVWGRQRHPYNACREGQG